MSLIAIYSEMASIHYFTDQTKSGAPVLVIEKKPSSGSRAPFTRHDAKLAYLKVDPWLEPLRSDPRIDDLVHRAGLSKSFAASMPNYRSFCAQRSQGFNAGGAACRHSTGYERNGCHSDDCERIACRIQWVHAVQG